MIQKVTKTEKHIKNLKNKKVIARTRLKVRKCIQNLTKSIKNINITLILKISTGKRGIKNVNTSITVTQIVNLIRQTVTPMTKTTKEVIKQRRGNIIITIVALIVVKVNLDQLIEKLICNEHLC